MSRIGCLFLLTFASGCSVRNAGDNPAASGNAPKSIGKSEARGELVEAVVYTTLRPPNLDVYLYEGSVGAPRRITDDPALDYNAVFSPDGRWVVFTSERSGSAELYALRLEAGGSPIRLTDNPAMDDAASFAPDGRRLAFVSSRDGNADIFVMPFAPTDTAADRSAVNLTSRPGGDFNPAFSPDGRHIAFSRQPCVHDDEGWHCLDLELCIMSADGSSVRPLPAPRAGVPEDVVDVELYSGSPAWSLDGTAIYYYYQYVYYRNSLTEHEEEVMGGPDIRRVTLDGGNDQLVAHAGYSPTIAPDDRIAFVRPLVGDGPPSYDSGQIFSVAADGSNLRAETPTPANSLDSCFAPDFDRRSGRMVCHGPGTHPGGPKLPGGTNFAQPGAVGQVDLPDRTIAVRGIGGYFPALTPDGSVLSTLRIRPAIEAQADLNERLTVPLHISTIDGTGLREVFIPSIGIAWGAHVARDAGRVVATVGPTFGGPDSNVDVWTFRLDGSEARKLTGDSPGNDAMATISSDGQHIVFRRPRGSATDSRQVSAEQREMAIFVTDGQGKNQRRLTTGAARETMPAISPDGEWVAYVVVGEYDLAKIWLSRRDGSQRRLLEPERSHISDLSLHPRFSPDGRWIVFTSDRGGLNDERPLTPQPQPYGDLWAVPVAGGPAVRVTSDKWEDGPNDWGYIRLPLNSSDQ